jgi:predicted metal-dependent hydrolase
MRERVLQDWYRDRLRELAAPLVAEWGARIGVWPEAVRIRRMKTRWGSCSRDARRIWLNSELVKKPIGCIEYLIVHEMIHLIEPRHGARFRDLMDGFMPAWRTLRDMLNREPLAHADWKY